MRLITIFQIPKLKANLSRNEFQVKQEALVCFHRLVMGFWISASDPKGLLAPELDVRVFHSCSLCHQSHHHSKSPFGLMSPEH